VLHRHGEVEVRAAIHVAGKGRLATVYVVVCLHDRCESFNGGPGPFRDPDRARRAANGHRHRLIPAYEHPGRWRRRRLQRKRGMR
jgi:hypothetical protein